MHSVFIPRPSVSLAQWARSVFFTLVGDFTRPPLAPSRLPVVCLGLDLAHEPSQASSQLIEVQAIERLMGEALLEAVEGMVEEVRVEEEVVVVEVVVRWWQWQSSLTSP